jgi:hypothetical protein
MDSSTVVPRIARGEGVSVRPLRASSVLSVHASTSTKALSVRRAIGVVGVLEVMAVGYLEWGLIFNDVLKDRIGLATLCLEALMKIICLEEAMATKVYRGPERKEKQAETGKWDGDMESRIWEPGANGRSTCMNARRSLISKVSRIW